MKAEMKAVVASLVVIALALTAVSGITYSWFSDEEKATITVETGNIDLNLSSLNVKVYSSGSDSNSPRFNKDYSITNGVVSITPSTIMDKDKIVVSVPEFTISHNIDINYYETCDIDGTAPTYFEINGIQSVAKQFASGAEAKINAHEIIIYFDSDGEGMEQEYTITLTFNAAQINKPIDAGISTDVSDEGTTLVIPTGASSVTGTAKVAIPSGSGVSGTATVVEATTVTASSSGYSTVSSLGIVSGIELTVTDSNGNKLDLKGTAVTLTFVINGNFTKDNNNTLRDDVKIYHNDAVFSPGDGESFDATYNSVLDTTTITVITKQGFSPYFVTTGVAKIGETYYTSLVKAIENVQSDETIDIIADYTEKSPISITKAVTIEGNGHTITTRAAYYNSDTDKQTNVHGIDINTTDSAEVIIKNLTLVDSTPDNDVNSTTKLESYGIVSGDSSKVNLILNNVSITGYNTKGTYITGASAVSIIGGTYTDNASNVNDIVEDAVITGTKAFMGGDHALQIDIKNDTDTTITIDGVTFKGHNGCISPICISQRAGDNDGTSAYISSATITNCVFSGDSGVLGDISIGTTPKTDAKPYALTAVPAKTGNQAFPLEITACGDTVVCYRGGMASENKNIYTVDVAPLQLTLSDGAKIVSKGEVKGVNSTLNITVTGTATAAGTIKSSESVTGVDTTKLANYKVGDETYATLSAAIEAASSGSTVTVLANALTDSQVSIKKNIILELNGHSIAASTSNLVGVFKVDSAGTLTINGNGYVYGGNGDNNTTIRADGGTVIINGGKYNVGADAKQQGNNTIYSVNQGEVYIYGGEFSSEAQYDGRYYVLNQDNIHNAPGAIFVYGGTFYGQNPEDGDDYYKESFVQTGYKSVKTSDEGNGTYVVSKA